MTLTRATRGLVLAASLLGVTRTATCQGSLSISGTASYRERMALPPDAVFEVTLEDVSQADAPSQVISSTRIERPGTPPFHFTIDYDPGQILPNHTYSVRGRITEGAKLLFTTDQRYQVLTGGHGSDIAMMMLKRVSASPSSGASAPTALPLRETYWKLVQLGDRQVTAADQQQEANLRFLTEGNRLSGSGGCNRVAGTYTLDGNSLHFNGVASTRMACMRGMETESTFLETLNRVQAWTINGRQLDLNDSAGKLLARFIGQETR